MKRWVIVSTIVLSMIILLSSYTSQAASQTASTTKAAKSSTTAKPSPKATAISTAGTTTAAQPQPGGIWKVMIKARSNTFGYPPRMTGAARDYAPPFFDRLIRLGDDGKYKPELALSWDTSRDGKTITFKLRQGVTFHDGTPFNAQAVKSNIDNLIRPEGPIVPGITSVDVVDDYTVKLNLSADNNLILYHFYANPVTYMYSPEAVKKNGADWATTHPVGTGPFMLKDYVPDISLTLVKNPNYWQKGLPYLDGINIMIVTNAMTQMLTLKAGQANAIYSVQEAAAQLRDEGYPLLSCLGGLIGIAFDTKNSEYFSKRKVREAIEYAIDKEAICSGPGEGLYTPLYQIVTSDRPDYNPACPSRKYDPAKAKKLLAETGYPNGFSFKIFVQDSTWKEGLVAVQSYLDKVGIKMEIAYVSTSAYNLIRAEGKVEKGAAVFTSFTTTLNTLFGLDAEWRSNSAYHQYIVKPAGIDKLIDQAKLSKDPAAIIKINRQIMKLIYDDETLIPLWRVHRMAVVDKSVQNTGWFINGDQDNNQFGTRTWLKR
jgi:peptide/nickel transport system substrate-binding protein